MSTYHKGEDRAAGPKLKQIFHGDLPPEMREIANLVGLENTVNLIAHYSGQAVYFPKYETATLKLRNRRIYQEFDGSNVRALAKKYNLSQRHIRKILEQKNREL